MLRPIRFESTISVVLFAVLAAANAPAAQNVRILNRAMANQDAAFEVYLPLQRTAELDRLLAAQHTAGSPEFRKWLTPAEFRARFGASPADINRATQALQSYGLSVTAVHSQSLEVTGKISAVESAFGIQLSNAVTSQGQQTLVAAEAPSIPAALSQLGAQVVHFSPFIRQHTHSRRSGSVPENRNSATGGYWFDDLKQAYQFPSYQSLTGKGRTIGILMSSDYNDKDINTYFAHENLKTPTLVRRPVSGGAAFNTGSSASLEVELDVEQAGGMAPGATIEVYNIPNLSDQSILAGYTAIIEDNKADIVNLSFGGPEGFYLAAYNNGIDATGILKSYESLFKQGNAQGITFIASSGDSGGYSLPSLSYFTTMPQNPPVIAGDFRPGIEYPTSSPNVTAVGGTNLLTTYNPPSLRSQYAGENAYADLLLPEDPYGTGNLLQGGFWASGGGTSIFFHKPSYQLLVNAHGNNRSIPDVSLHMGGCPSGSQTPCAADRSYDVEVFGGNTIGVIGTSASAPDFAGLLALKEEYLGGVRLGNENYDIYGLAAAQFTGGSKLKVFHEGVSGWNGPYNADPEYNKVLGNGTVFGNAFIQAPSLPVAGDPQTPSNP
jgi:subtilase family serine protease